MVKAFDPKEMRKEERRKVFHEKLDQFKNWFERNKDMIYLITPLAVTGLTTTVKVVGKTINVYKEKELKDRYVYDRSVGQYVHTRRALRSKEQLELAQRKMKGENVTQILHDMRLTK